MPATLEGQLVVAISSRALFDFEQENLVFEQGDDSAYMQLQLARRYARRVGGSKPRRCTGSPPEPPNCR